MAEATFQEALSLGLIPLTGSGAIDFSKGWFGLARYAEKKDLTPEKEHLDQIRSRIEEGIVGSRRSYSAPPGMSTMVEDGVFFTPEGRAAFQKNAVNIRIKGQQISSQLSPSWWETEGFLSEEAAVAFKKAESAGQVRIFSRK
jgi:hypothetical protein